MPGRPMPDRNAGRQRAPHPDGRYHRRRARSGADAAPNGHSPGMAKGATMTRKKASDYPQELLDLFHEYQHGEITRRDFLERAQRFAVGGVTALALFESLKPNYAGAQKVKPDDPKIKTSRETVSAPEGHGEIKGYFARPAKSGRYPTVIVIHENRGLNPYIEDVARRF